MTPFEILTRWIDFIDRGHPSPYRPDFLRLLWLADGATFDLVTINRLRIFIQTLDQSKPDVKTITAWFMTNFPE